ERREIQVRNRLRRVGRDVRLLGIGGEPVRVPCDQLVPTLYLRSFVRGEGHHFVYVRLHVVDEARHTKRQHVRVRETERRAACCLRERDAVRERRVAKARVVLERVVRGVVRAAAALAAVAQVQRRDAEV